MILHACNPSKVAEGSPVQDDLDPHKLTTSPKSKGKEFSPVIEHFLSMCKTFRHVPKLQEKQKKMNALSKATLK